MARRQPNVIFIMTDEENLRALSCYRGSVSQTPTVDRMAREGVLYERAYCVYPVCMPSRAACMTGRYPHVNGVRSNGISLPRRELHLPGLLKMAGYRTALFGKDHCFRPQGEASAFDERVTAMHFGLHEVPDDFGALAREATEYHYNLRDQVSCAFGQAVLPYPPEVCDEGLITEAALRFIDRIGAQPFFMWLSYPGPHWPFTVPEAYEGVVAPEDVDLPPQDELGTKPLCQRVTRKVLGFDAATEADWRRVISLYYGHCRYIDDMIGRVFERLDRAGLGEDTIVIFTSDHGDYLGEHGLLHKSNTMYDALTRIPYVWWWPGRFPAGARTDALTENVDLLPTVLDLCGAQTPPGVQGLSHARALLGEEDYPAREACFSEAGTEVRPHRPKSLDDLEALSNPFENWRRVTAEGYWGGRVKMVRTDRWKYVWYDTGEAELYDMDADPWELRNLAPVPGHEEIVAEHKDRLLNWCVASEDAMPPLGKDQKARFKPLYERWIASGLPDPYYWGDVPKA